VSWRFTDFNWKNVLLFKNTIGAIPLRFCNSYHLRRGVNSVRSFSRCWTVVGLLLLKS